MASRSLFAFFLLLLPLAGTSYAQDFGSEREAFIYDFARPGRATITVYVWGQIGSPGIWQIEPGTTLIELLSAARVPGVGSEQQEYRRITRVKIYRGRGVQRQLVYEAELRDLLTEEQQTYPTLRDGDILEVEVDQDRRLTFRTITQYVGTAASLTLLALRLARYWR